jgi:hypothetical protein
LSALRFVDHARRILPASILALERICHKFGAAHSRVAATTG